MDLRHMRYFLAVAEEKNFTRAAQRLGLAQPPLSQQIRALEREIGAALFRRLPHGAELTEAGLAFRDEAQATLAQAERALASAQRAARGEIGALRLGFTASAAFNPIVALTIRSFRRSYPHIHLSLEESNTLRLSERLLAGEVDAAFLRPGPGLPDTLRHYPLSSEPLIIVMPSSHPLANSPSLSLDRLADQPFVLFPRAIGLSLFDEVIRACRQAGFDPKMGQEAPQIASVVNLVAAEMGISLVPASIAQVRVDGVSYVPVAGQTPEAHLSLAMRRDSPGIIIRNLTALVLGLKRKIDSGHPAQAAPRQV